MTATVQNRSIDQSVAGAPCVAQLGVDGGSCIPEGAFVAPLTATGMATNGGGVASTGPVIGVAKHRADNTSGADGAISVDVLKGVFIRANSGTNPLDVTDIDGPCYAEDNQTVRHDGGATYPLLGIVQGFEADGRVQVGIGVTSSNYLLNQGSLAAALAGVTGANGLNQVGYDDSGNKTTAATGADALDELYVDAISAFGTIVLRPTEFILATGAPMAAWSNATTTVPGLCVDGGEACGVRWNNAATFDQIAASFVVPYDMDLTANAQIIIHCAKTGATNNAGNTTTFAISLFNNVVGALYDADADYGGASSAVLPSATSKTVQAVTRTITAADLPVAGTNVTILLDPTDSTLDTDDISVLSVKVKYTRKLRTA